MTKQSLVGRECIQDMISADDSFIRQSLGPSMSTLTVVLDLHAKATILYGSTAQDSNQMMWVV